MEKEITCFEAARVMEKALDVGEAMLCTGAEISRVEDTILRICHSYGGGVIDVFTILSLIILSWHTTDDQNFTQTRRIYSYSTDLGKLEELNALSRYICANRPFCDEIEQKVEEIMHGDRRSISRSRMTGYVLGAGAFAVFFGGNMRDGVAAGMVALIFYFWEYIFGPRSKNRVVYTLLSSFAVGVLCILSVLCGLGIHVDKVMIGNIMLQIPGINMMNAIRDMMCGDMITGLLRLMEAIILAVAIAAGFALAIIGFTKMGIGV